MATDEARWNRLRAGLESDLRIAADRRKLLEEFGVDASQLESRVLRLVRDRREDIIVNDSRDHRESDRSAQLPIEITEVRITPKRQGRLRALCSVTFAGVFVIRGVKVIEGPERLFLAMPSRKEQDGKYRDVCHPVATFFREQLEARVIAEYLRKVGESEALSADGRGSYRSGE